MYIRFYNSPKAKKNYSGLFRITLTFDISFVNIAYLAALSQVDVLRLKSSLEVPSDPKIIHKHSH